jgi:hypothetical protein
MRKMGVQTVAVEELSGETGELAIEAAAISKRCGGCVDLKAWRLSFFASPVHPQLLPYVSNDDYLGYAVFIAVELPNKEVTPYVYESVIATPSPHIGSVGGRRLALPTHYVHCVRRYPAWVGERRFTLFGSFFSQQNNLTHVCAQASLRWLLNNLPERADSIVSYEDINHVIGIDHTTRRVGQYNDSEPIGLPIGDLEKVIEDSGYRCIRADYENPSDSPTEPYWRFMYSIVESGFPVLLGFTARGARHVICAIGHTLNTDIWDAEARPAYAGAPDALYLPTVEWVDHFVVHDDNYGMYFCMPTKALALPAISGGGFKVTDALGVVPREIEVGPLDAELYASTVLRRLLDADVLARSYWVDALRQDQAAPLKWVVLRTLFTSRTNYEEHLQNMEDGGGNRLTQDDLDIIVTARLPQYFWVTEVTLTDIYTANKHKLGEVIFQSADMGISAKEQEGQDLQEYTRMVWRGCKAIRLPGHILIPEVTDESIAVKMHHTCLEGHVPLLRSCRMNHPWEW